MVFCFHVLNYIPRVYWLSSTLLLFCINIYIGLSLVVLYTVLVRYTVNCCEARSLGVICSHLVPHL